MKRKKNIAIVAHDHRKKDFIISSDLFHAHYKPAIKNYQSYISRDLDLG